MRVFLLRKLLERCCSLQRNPLGRSEPSVQKLGGDCHLLPADPQITLLPVKLPGASQPPPLIQTFPVLTKEFLQVLSGELHLRNPRSLYTGSSVSTAPQRQWVKLYHRTGCIMPGLVAARVCARAPAHVCACACVCPCVCVHMCAHVRVRVCVHACIVRHAP